MRPARLLWLFLRIGAMNELQYRANFWLQLLQSGIAVGTGLAVLGLVFSQTPALNGWTPSELLAVMGVHILMGGLIGTLIQPNMERLREDIRLRSHRVAGGLHGEHRDVGLNGVAECERLRPLNRLSVAGTVER